MKLHRDITINGKPYAAGMQVAGKFIYPFFLLHMGLFGLSGFLMAYAADDAPLHFLFLHGGIAIGVYLMFYLAIFGRDEVRWMLVNAALGLFGIYVEIGWLLSLFGKSPGDFGWMRHVVPFSYYILYTFLPAAAVGAGPVRCPGGPGSAQARRSRLRHRLAAAVPGDVGRRALNQR